MKKPGWTEICRQNRRREGKERGDDPCVFYLAFTEKKNRSAKAAGYLMFRAIESHLSTLLLASKDRALEFFTSMQELLKP